jgi:hypothetical protein
MGGCEIGVSLPPSLSLSLGGLDSLRDGEWRWLWLEFCVRPLMC